MVFVTTATSAAVALLGVALGGWLSTRNQDRSWKREHARQWRDIRLETYGDFASAYRELVAFAVDPTAKITADPHPQRAGELMPRFDDEGRRYKERLDAASVAVRLVSESTDTMKACAAVVQSVRRIAAARAESQGVDIPVEAFQALWAAQDAFLSTTRRELGLSDVSWETVYPADESGATV
ncbi:hypothetical protein [Catenulispora rubra]|uniref:hypothetical protein n=1 Tax=Catenulispora rubra TaxID=280293 RepID=UPI00189274F8|nr:hypothetical protein [Catenulispora rubra]